MRYIDDVTRFLGVNYAICVFWLDNNVVCLIHSCYHVFSIFFCSLLWIQPIASIVARGSKIQTSIIGMRGYLNWGLTKELRKNHFIRLNIDRIYLPKQTNTKRRFPLITKPMSITFSLCVREKVGWKFIPLTIWQLIKFLCSFSHIIYLMSPIICLNDTRQWFYELPCDRLEENFVRMLSNIKN